jgi:hypothetical protein
LARSSAAVKVTAVSSFVDFASSLAVGASFTSVTVMTKV